MILRATQAWWPRMAGVLGLLTVLTAACGGSGGGPQSASKPKIGVIQITLTHGYQQILNEGYKTQAAKNGVDVAFCINNLNPSQDVRCAEDLLSGGATVLINAPADPGSWSSVLQVAKAKNVPVVNDGSPETITPGMVPFTGTDSVLAGKLDGDFTVKWIKTNLAGKATVAELTLPTFTDCQNRNKGFHQSLDTLTTAPIVASADGKGQRASALPATENMLQGHPDINVVFGCNDDSALGALSALQGKNKVAASTLVVGIDGTQEAFQEIQKAGMFRADVAQRPDCYSRRMMDIASQLGKKEKTVESYNSQGFYFMKPALVTKDNVDNWLKWKGTPETAPEPCAFSTNHQ